MDSFPYSLAYWLDNGQTQDEVWMNKSQFFLGIGLRAYSQGESNEQSKETQAREDAETP